MTALDRKIMGSLYPDALQPVIQVAAEVGVTPRTVRNRLARLAALRAFCILPCFSPARVSGMIPFFLLAEVEDAAAAPRFLAAFPEGVSRSFAGAVTPYVVLVAPDAAAVDEMVRRAERVPGVHRAEARLLQDSTPCPPNQVLRHPLQLVEPSDS